MNYKAKPVTYSIIYYIITWLLIWVFNSFDTFKSGPCTMGLDLFSVFLAILISLAIIVITLIKAIIRRKRLNWKYLLVNVLGLGSYFFIVWLLW
ncbi:hypothetical protein IM792_07690 [Mucilaginibacter sp. JRF]|uniref:hypothetical protein n=1 Tax=Mucilaginibacter sp. JRF TaxID=2780088 RepID=UPI001881E8FB|nr:hypothetical protein [Mucilaginibacter sp. JRF]MBE9584325.1 hypothetical protein [Mucilaginibacter sp. JRF]